MLAHRRTVRAVWFVLLLALTCALPVDLRADNEPHVDLLTMTGAVDPWAASYIERGVTYAEHDGAEAVVIALNTPGGTLTAMQRITTALLGAEVPVIVYVSPSGAWAASAGTFVGMASNVLAMAPGTTIGAAHPVQATGTDIAGDEREKTTNAAAALIESIAQQRGRNADWAGRSVRESLAATAEEAVTLHVSDLVAADLNDLLRQIDGRVVRTAAGERTLHTAQARVATIDLTTIERFFHTLVDPNIALVLLQLGLLALVVELYNPGISFAGIVGGICLVLALVALGNLPTNWAGVGLVVVSVIMFVIDIKVNSTVLTVGGVATFVFGALLLFAPVARSPMWPRATVSPFVIATLAGLALLVFGVVLTAAVRGRRAPVLMGAESLIGVEGIAKTDLAPRGQVQLKSELWSAIAEGGEIHQGEHVRVVRVEGLVLHVVRRAD